jgi:hypothetical protein
MRSPNLARSDLSLMANERKEMRSSSKKLWKSIPISSEIKANEKNNNRRKVTPCGAMSIRAEKKVSFFKLDYNLFKLVGYVES